MVVCEDNQEIVDNSDIVFVCLLPNVASSVIPSLKFSSSQLIISAMATLDLETLHTLFSNTGSVRENIIRTVPLPPISKRKGPILMYPDESRARAFLSQVGEVVCVSNEEQFKPLIALTGSLISTFYMLQDTVTQWCVSQGCGEESAGTYVGSFYKSLADASLDGAPYVHDKYKHMAVEAATPGGLNEQALRETQEMGVYKIFEEVTSHIYKRL